MSDSDTLVPGFDVEAVRKRFTALQSDLTYLDSPGGSQVPDEVIGAISTYLRESNANARRLYETSRRTSELVDSTRNATAELLGASADNVIFGANMTTLNFMLSRTVARTLSEGDEVLVTRLDHDANISPWLEIAHDIGIRVNLVDLNEDSTVNLTDLENKLTDRTRIVAFPWASNALGTITDARRIVELARSAGALSWVDAVQYAPHGAVDFAGLGADVLLCSAYKFAGPHIGIGLVRDSLLRQWRPFKARPATTTPPGQAYETGTSAHELLAGLSATIDYLKSVGFEAIDAQQRVLGQRFLDGLPDSCQLYGLDKMDSRVATFAFNVKGRTPREVAQYLADRQIAVSFGNYYAVEVMRHLNLDAGAVRVGFAHYNNAAEVDRLLDALRAL